MVNWSEEEMSYYSVCPHCGAHLDPCEACHCGAERVRVEGGGTVFADEAVWCCGAAFPSAKAANGWAGEEASAAELLAYARENGRALSAYIGGNLDVFVFDMLNSGAKAKDAVLGMLREFAKSDGAFFDWLGWEREQ